jgi:phosphopantetheinyl transferase (holo-ACP synthase)
MASGIPIITTDLPSIREIVGSEDVFFTKDNSPAEIAECKGKADALAVRFAAKEAVVKRWGPASVRWGGLKSRPYPSGAGNLILSFMEGPCSFLNIWA